MITTGVRVSELIALKINDVTVATGANHLKVHGKGRNDRTTPLKARPPPRSAPGYTNAPAASEDPLFPTRQGHQLHRRTVALLVTKHARATAACCPLLASSASPPHLGTPTRNAPPSESTSTSRPSRSGSATRASRRTYITSTPTTNSSDKSIDRTARSAPHPATPAPRHPHRPSSSTLIIRSSPPANPVPQPAQNADTTTTAHKRTLNIEAGVGLPFTSDVLIATSGGSRHAAQQLFVAQLDRRTQTAARSTGRSGSGLSAVRGTSVGSAGKLTSRS